MSKKIQETKLTRGRIPICNEKQIEVSLQKKLVRIAELHQGLDILKHRMSEAKEDLLKYMHDHQTAKLPKYAIGDRYIRYLDKSVSDGLSQKLIKSGLIEYFISIGHSPDQSQIDAKNAMDMILGARKTKVVSTINIDLNGAKKDDQEDDLV